MAKSKKLALCLAFPLTLLAILISPLALHSLPIPQTYAEHWWCKGCGLAYPTSTKTCLNKDCPYHKQRIR